MKRIITFALTAVIIAALCCVFASAEAYGLIPKDAEWTKEDNGNVSVEVSWEGDTAVFSGSVSGTWPAVYTTYDEVIKAGMNDVIRYEFEVDTGATNISFRFANDSSSEIVGFPISNTALGDVSFDSGSGDLNPGTYKGSFTVKQLVESKANLSSTPFNPDYVVNDEVWFAGIQVFSVNGATIRVKTLEVTTDGAGTEDPGTESSEEPVASSEEPIDSSEEPVESSESAPVSSEVPADPESSAAPADNSALSAAESSAGTASADDNKTESSNWWIWVVIAAVVVCAAIACGVIVSKKKK